MQTRKKTQYTPRREPLFQSIAEQLKKEFEHSGAVLLPTIEDLRTRFGVSNNTIIKAVRVLRSLGIVRVRQGRRISVVPSGGSTSLPRSIEGASSCRKVYKRLKLRITTGVYRAGQPLPKAVSLEHSERVGDKTISGALKMLCAEGLIHRENRRWVVGPCAAPSPASMVLLSPSVRPMILVLWPGFKTWDRQCNSPYDRFHPFFESFVDEAEKLDIAIVHGYFKDEQTDASFPKGMKEIFDLIERHKERYRGTLLCKYSLVDEPWLRQLAHFNRTVIYSPALNTIPDAKDYPGCLFCVRSEREAVKLALDALVTHGHRVIGMLRGHSNEDQQPIPWIERRLRPLQELASEHYPDVKIVVADQYERFWYDDSWRSNTHLFRSFVQDLAAEQLKTSAAAAKGDVHSYRQSLKQCSPGLWDLVSVHGCTALVAANDMHARLCAVWLEQLGISVPQDLSLIGFDNDASSRYHHISTIDYGFGQLGYLAAHALIGDIPVRVGRDGILRGVPRFVNRGTIKYIGASSCTQHPA